MSVDKLQNKNRATIRGELKIYKNSGHCNAHTVHSVGETL